jgi:hypothetical protein
VKLLDDEGDDDDDVGELVSVGELGPRVVVIVIVGLFELPSAEKFIVAF